MVHFSLDHINFYHGPPAFRNPPQSAYVPSTPLADRIFEAPNLAGTQGRNSSAPTYVDQLPPPDPQYPHIPNFDLLMATAHEGPNQDSHRHSLPSNGRAKSGVSQNEGSTSVVETADSDDCILLPDDGRAPPNEILGHAPVTPIDNHLSSDRLDCVAQLSPPLPPTFHGAIKTRRRTRMSTVKEGHISPPPNHQEPGADAIGRTRPRIRASTAKHHHDITNAKARQRASTAKEGHVTTKAKPRQRASTAKERQSMTKVKARTRGSITKKHCSGSPLSSPRSDLSVAI